MHSFVAVNFMLYTLHTNYGVNFNFINDSLYLIVNSEQCDEFFNFLFEPEPNKKQFSTSLTHFKSAFNPDRLSI